MKKLALVLLITSFSVMAESIPEKPPISYSYTNWEIDYSTVCQNYKRGSVIYRNCRSYALEFFRDQCDDFTRQVDNYGSNASVQTIKHKDMFCHASASYTPIN